MKTISKEKMNVILNNAPEGSNKKSIIDKLIMKGYNIEGVNNESIRSRLKKQESEKTVLGEAKNDILGIGKEFKENLQKRGANIAKSKKLLDEGKQGHIRSIAQSFGQTAGLVADNIYSIGKGIANTFISDKTEKKITKTLEDTVGKTLSPAIQAVDNKLIDIGKNNPSLEADLRGLLGAAELGLDLVGGGTVAKGAKGATKTVKTVTKPVVNAVVDVADTASDLGKKAVREVAGKLSGTSEETLAAAFDAVKKGGKAKQAFSDALRNKVTPETIANDFRDSIDKLDIQKSTNYKKALEGMKNNTVTTREITDSFAEKLNEFGVKITDKGTLDYSNSALRTVPNAQTKINTAFLEMQNLAKKGETNILDIDTTRRALSELKLVGDDASARSANALIEEAISKVKQTGSQVDGYSNMLKSFSDDISFIKDLRKGLMAGDKQTLDQTYRRMTTALKTNNEARKALVNELDEMLDTHTIPRIAGQQLHEWMPRGIVGRIVAPFVGGAAVTGGVSASFLPLLALSSPRAIGGIIERLAMPTTKAKYLKDSVMKARGIISDVWQVQPESLAPVFLNGQLEQIDQNKNTK